jgi:hypothetical protein
MSGPQSPALAEVMLPRLIDSRYVSAYRVWIRFDDGAEGEVDLVDDLNGPVFEPLRDLVAFQRFELHTLLRTLVWPNGADFAPEFLRARLR